MRTLVVSLLALICVVLGAQLSYALKDGDMVDIGGIDVEQAVVMGNPNAATRLIVFTEPDCPYCRKYHKELKRLTAENPTVAVLLLLNPLPMHPDAYGKSLGIIDSRSPDVLDSAFSGDSVQKGGSAAAKTILEGMMAQAKKLNIVGVPTAIMPNGKVVMGSRDYGTLQNLVASNPPQSAAAAAPPPRTAAPQKTAVPDKAPPPTITITSPDVQRSLALVAKTSAVTVTGRAQSNIGVARVTVNGDTAELDEQGNFSAEVLLRVGTNRITVTATDIRRATSTKTFTLVREAGHLTRPATAAAESAPAASGTFHALIIGIKEYADPDIPSLDHPLQDAQRVYDLLTTAYTFDRKYVTFLKNPDQGKIIDALDSLANKVGEGDSLLVFYAGHGFWDEKLKQGYWLPADASKRSRARWLSNSTIRDYINGIKSRHTLLVADACFSGGIFKTRSIGDSSPRAVQELFRLPSRKAMTSGTMKEVPDRSVFVEYLLKRLKENQEQFISSEQLFSSLRQAVINNSPNAQVPQFGEIRETGDEGGDFLFVRKGR